MLMIDQFWAPLLSGAPLPNKAWQDATWCRPTDRWGTIIRICFEEHRELLRSVMNIGEPGGNVGITVINLNPGFLVILESRLGMVRILLKQSDN